MNQQRDIIVTQIINELGVTIETNTKPLIHCKDCMYAKLFEDRNGLCGHPSNNAWDIFDEFYCGRGVKNE